MGPAFILAILIWTRPKFGMLSTNKTSKEKTGSMGHPRFCLTLADVAKTEQGCSGETW